MQSKCVTSRLSLTRVKYSLHGVKPEPLERQRLRWQEKHGLASSRQPHWLVRVQSVVPLGQKLLLLFVCFSAAWVCFIEPMAPGWKHGVLTTEPPGKPPETVLSDQHRCLSCHHFKIWLFLPNIWVSNFSWIIWRSINLVSAHLHSRWACGINISLPYWRHSTHVLCSAPWNVNSSLTCKS